MHLPLYYMGIMAVAVGPLGESIVLVLALVSGNATWFKIVTLLSDSSFWHFFYFCRVCTRVCCEFLEREHLCVADDELKAPDMSEDKAKVAAAEPSTVLVR
jgi:hypothetical protein